jgi:polysaccharide export outer membrane protein
LIYLQDLKSISVSIVKTQQSKIQIGDVLKIDVNTLVPEASLPYNYKNDENILTSSFDILKLNGYLVDDDFCINFPIIGSVNVNDLSFSELEGKIFNLLVDGNHLTNPIINVRRLNSKFTILGEVLNPGTFPYSDEKLNIFQALGYAGDLTIDGQRKNITFIREENGVRNVWKISLTDSNILQQPYFNIKNNDVIIVNPTFNKVKSAGFIGRPESIASISSLLLSITLLIINR